MPNHNNSRVSKEDNSENIKHFTMKFIARSYPEWVKPDGSCPRCENFYENELDTIVQVVGN